MQPAVHLISGSLRQVAQKQTIVYNQQVVSILQILFQTSERRKGLWRDLTCLDPCIGLLPRGLLSDMEYLLSVLSFSDTFL